MNLRSTFSILALTLAFPLAAQAQVPVPGHHPAYLHAITDLRDARWLLEHPRDGHLGERERHAMMEIDRAIDSTKRAAYYDGKNVYEHPREDTYPDAVGRLRRVSELIHKARQDAAMPEDNPQVRELQFHAVEHIDSAIRAIDSLVLDRERMRERGRDYDYDRR